MNSKQPAEGYDSSFHTRMVTERERRINTVSKLENKIVYGGDRKYLEIIFGIKREIHITTN